MVLYIIECIFVCSELGVRCFTITVKEVPLPTGTSSHQNIEFPS